MNTLEIEQNFKECCVYYAQHYSPVNSINDLYKSKLVEIETKEKKHFNDPMFRTEIVEWNHNSPVPTHKDFEKFTVQLVLENYKTLMRLRGVKEEVEQTKQKEQQLQKGQELRKELQEKRVENVLKKLKEQKEQNEQKEQRQLKL